MPYFLNKCIFLLMYEQIYLNEIEMLAHRTLWSTVLIITLNSKSILRHFSSFSWKIRLADGHSPFLTACPSSLDTIKVRFPLSHVGISKVFQK